MMATRWMVIGLTAVMMVGVGACGSEKPEGNSADTGIDWTPPATCDEVEADFAACGGDPVGTWRPDIACVSTVGIPMLQGLPGCFEAETGPAILTGDLLVSDKGCTGVTGNQCVTSASTLKLSGTAKISAVCLDQIAAALNQAREEGTLPLPTAIPTGNPQVTCMAMGLAMAAGQYGTCLWSATTTSCDCTFSPAAQATNLSATWTKTASTLELTPTDGSGALQWPFCQMGEYLNVQNTESGMIVRYKRVP